MAIWFQRPTLEELQRLSARTLAAHLGMAVTEVGDDYLRGTMPVDARTLQPSGLLHGGASAALAESLGSMAAYCCVDPSRYTCVGQEINANHVRGMRTGVATGTARPFHLGRRSHVWGIEIRDEAERLVCVSRLTVAVLERPAA
jgi:1,4-dihydroxy-2-naphthoyl-CoA hydrolase